MKRFFITTPIYYVNDKPHIGHAYTSVACDVMARFKRLDGYDVRFLTGTDEHGQKVEKSAEKAGKKPQDFVDEVSVSFRELTGLMNISNDDFIRTTEPRHAAACQEIWRRMRDNGHIYLDSYGGWYSVRDEAFYQESELVDGKAPTGAPVEWVEEPSYFFDLSKWQDKLLSHYETHPDFIAPASRRNEVMSFVKGGLKDLSISRTTFGWGIKVPEDEAHVMYVWLDALTNYISALGYPDKSAENYKKFWADADVFSMHMVGKDIIRFHTVYWPAFLMAADLPLPKRVFAHGWWTIEGEKMSKSLNNAIPPADLVNTFGLDQTRYFLMREVPFGNDGNFARTAMINRINSELANNIGNLVQRTLSMINKNCDAKVPANDAPEAADKALLETASTLLGNYRTFFDNQQFHLALDGLVDLASRANEYIDTQAPWKLKKENPKRMENVLWTLAETIRHIGILLQPFMPESSSKILDQLAVAENARNFASLNAKSALKPGTPLSPPSGIFPRFSDDESARQGG